MIIWSIFKPVSEVGWSVDCVVKVHYVNVLSSAINNDKFLLKRCVIFFLSLARNTDSGYSLGSNGYPQSMIRAN